MASRRHNGDLALDAACRGLLGIAARVGEALRGCGEQALGGLFSQHIERIRLVIRKRDEDLIRQERAAARKAEKSATKKKH
jgi:hypothetical protein